MVRPEVKKRREEAAAKAAQSRKTRKKLEKIVLHKKNKTDRSAIIAKLKEFQLQDDQLDVLHSTSSMQTRGLKRFLNDNDTNADTSKLKATDRAERCLDASILLKKRRRGKSKSGFASSDSSSSSEDTDDVSTDTEEYDFSDCDENGETALSSPSRPSSALKSDNKVQNGDKLEGEKSLPSSLSSISPTPKEIPIRTSELLQQAMPRQPAIYVAVSRDPDIEQSRLKLPIIGEEQNIIETIRYNDVVIVSGETGSGKTTQIPQFLYEAGYALNGKIIGITEPRRVAAVSMSDRVARELNLTSEEVSYQIRFSGNVSDKTMIKFMTDGVLLRECQHDFLLSKYSVIIIDEAHERSVFSDILIGLLSRIVPMRAKRENPLKLIIMSATLRVDDFTNNSFLFKQPPPTINIEARQFSVATHFAKKTPDNYLSAAYKKVCSVHSRMPKGGILVFITSQMDVKILCKKLRAKFPSSGSTISHHRSKRDRFDTDEGVDDDEDDDNESGEELGLIHSSKSPLHCLGLYAMLPLAKQKLVFKDPPEGTRLCVVATNVAETSITIPNIKYVVDTGMEKTKVYDLVTGSSKFLTSWTSKSSAEQRKGRAGRTGPGHCFRLYSSAVFTNDFPDYAEPRILQKPVEDVLLQMKSMNIDNVVNFPFPTRPSLEALKTAEKKLIIFGALDDKDYRNARFADMAKTEFSCKLTQLGKAMSNFSIGARYSKLIVLSPFDLLPHVIALASALTTREMFLEGNKWSDLRKKWVGHGGSKLLGDFMLMIRAVSIAESSQCSSKVCGDNGLRVKAMLEIDKLRRQLLREVNKHLNHPPIDENTNLKKLGESQTKVMRQLLLSSFCDRVARKLPNGEVVVKASTGTNEKKKLKNAYECLETQKIAYISLDSSLKGEHPEYIIYKELYQGDKKMYMRDVAAIEPEWLPFYAFNQCNFSQSKDEFIVPPRYDKQLDQIICNRTATFGPLSWPLGHVDVPMHLLDSGVEIYKNFAQFLLAGDVIAWFKKYVDKLLSSPSIMTKPWSKLQPRTTKLLQVLLAHDIKSKKDLMKVWAEDPSVLKKEYLAWLPESMHGKMNEDWKKLV